MVKTVAIGDRVIGKGHPCFVIAEAGVNHNGSLDLALDLVRSAHKAGADAVNFSCSALKNRSLRELQPQNTNAGTRAKRR